MTAAEFYEKRLGKKPVKTPEPKIVPNRREVKHGKIARVAPPKTLDPHGKALVDLLGSWRIEQGLSLRVAGARIGLHENTIRGWELGREMSYQRLAMYVKSLGHSMKEVAELLDKS